MPALCDDELANVTGGTAETGPFANYTVGVNDTPGLIAMRFGTTVPALMRINHVTNANELKKLKNLLVPQN